MPARDPGAAPDIVAHRLTGRARTLRDFWLLHQAADKHGVTPLARVIAYADFEGKPIEFPTAPAGAIEKVLKDANMTKDDIACWEINEAFSVVALANQQILGLDAEKVNPRGGAVALGHPIGASGARITGTLAMQLQPGEFGCARYAALQPLGRGAGSCLCAVVVAGRAGRRAAAGGGDAPLVSCSFYRRLRQSCTPKHAWCAVRWFSGPARRARSPCT